MVIDDDVDDQELFQLALSDLGLDIECSTATNGYEGLQYLKDSTLPDIIFLDLNMPKMNGKECLKALKEDPALKHIPVIILSTSIDPSDKEETLSLGALQVIPKPSSISALTTILAGILKINKPFQTH